jgi:hypothetical protein
MAKRRRCRERDRDVDRDFRLLEKYTRPVPVEAFRDACARADAAVASPHPLLHERVSPHVILTEARPGEPQALRLADTPMNRINLTLRECFADSLEYMCAATRLWALLDLLDDPRLDPWILVKKPDGGCEFHDALIDMAAAAPVNDQGDFLVEPFLAALARWAQEHPAWHAAEMHKRRRP